MKKVLFITNIPAPYRIDFFNTLGRVCDLTVIFEARRATGIRFNWNEDQAKNFKAIFLSDGEIDETHVNPAIFSYIKKGRFDHVVATSYGYFTETAALLKMRLIGIPYDLEIDGGVVRESEQKWKYTLKRMLIRGANHLFSSGTATDAVLLHYGGDQKKIVRYPFTSLHAADILPAVIQDERKSQIKKDLHIPYRRVVLSVGQFIHRKGYDVLLPVCQSLPDRTGVYIIGGKATEEYCRLQKSYGLSQVHFLDFMAKDVLEQWFLAADVFVLPTREDMWGLVINEAMAHALPVITTDRCNAGVELIENGVNGYLVPAEDGEALLLRLEEVLLNDALRYSMAEASLKKINAYTIEHMAQLHADTFMLAHEKQPMGQVAETQNTVPERLRTYFNEHKKVAIGLSGGVDSAYLLYAAVACGADVHAYFVSSAFQPAFEREDAVQVAAFCGGKFTVIRSVDVLANQQITNNPMDRCYYCKQAIFGTIAHAAQQDGYDLLLDGTNASDDADDRPGMRALAELSVDSPLRKCGLTKTEIRRHAEAAGIPVAQKPAYACLATRIPTGMPITAELLKRVENAESALFSLGFSDFRVRVRKDGALLQFTEKQLTDAKNRQGELAELLSPWFSGVSIDEQPRNVVNE